MTQYFYPEVGAPQTRLRETVAGLRRRGFEVTVVAPVPSYPLGIVPPPYRWWRPRVEVLDGVRVWRLPAIVRPGAGMSRRLVGHATFAFAALAAVALAPRTDVALIESPPLFLAGVARALRSAGIPYVFHVADPWPDFPIALGYLTSPVERRLAFAIEDFAYAGARAITTVTPGLVDLLESKASAAGRVRLVPNGVDVARFSPDLDPTEARRQLGWEDAFTLVYAGTVGLAQGVGTILDAAPLLGDGVRIHVVGEGVEKRSLEARAAETGVTNVVFHPAVRPTLVPTVFAAADAGLVLLRRGPLYEHSLPTKLLETMAAGRPVVVSADGNAARIVEDAKGGYLARAEDPFDLARAIEDSRVDPTRRNRGAAARAHVARHYGREAVLDELAAILAQAASSGPPARDRFE